MGDVCSSNIIQLNAATVTEGYETSQGLPAINFREVKGIHRSSAQTVMESACLLSVETNTLTGGTNPNILSNEGEKFLFFLVFALNYFPSRTC